MGSWVTYTAVPADGVTLQEFITRIGEELLATDLRDDLEPKGYREHGVVSERISSDVSRNDVLRLFGQLHESVRVVYLTSISDTSDSASIDVYEPTISGSLGKVGYRSGNLVFEDREQYDDRFDERAAAVRELDDPRMGTYSDQDYVEDLRVEYSGRPLFHYA